MLVSQCQTGTMIVFSVALELTSSCSSHLSRSNGPIRGKTIARRGERDVPEETEAGCCRLNVSDYTGIIYLYYIRRLQLLTRVNSLCPSVRVYTAVFPWRHEWMFAVGCQYTSWQTDQCLSPLVLTACFHTLIIYARASQPFNLRPKCKNKMSKEHLPKEINKTLHDPGL